MMASMQNSWPRKPLGDIADVISGYAFKSSEFCDRGIPVIKIKNIRVGSVDLSETDRVDEKYLTIPERYHVRPGDVLISLTGSHISQPNSVVGRVARHSTGLPHCLLNQRGGKVIVRDRSTCDLSFLFYALSEPETVRSIAMKAHGAANQANVSPTQVESIEIPFPPLPVQHRIAGILSAYDDLIENNQRRIKILEEMSRSLYREWFVNFRFPGHEKVPLVDSPLGPVPKGWDVKKLGDILELNYGKALKKEERRNGEFPVFGSSGIVGYHDAYLIDGPGIIVGRKGNVGSVFWSDEAFLVIDTAYFVTSLLPLRFLFYVLPTLNFINSDAAVPGLSRNQAYTLEIVVPPTNLLSRFCELADTFERQASTLQCKVQNLRQTRDLLLPRLLSGQISIAYDLG